MGQSQSSEYILPFGKRYIISYCAQYNIKDSGTFKDSVNVNIPVENNKTPLHLIYTLFYYKLNLIGYSIKPIWKHLNCNIPLETILEKISINSSDLVTLSDITIQRTCYYPTLDNIKSLLSNGNVLIGGMILGPKMCTDILNQTVNNLITDIVLIVGYTPSGILIKTTWTSGTIEIPNEYLSNFKELWDIYINSPEDKYICEYK